MAEPTTYITTPIYYVNDRPHIGHCYTTLIADCAVRFARLRVGESIDPGGTSDSKRQAPSSVFFLTGNDEHAEKVVTTAHEHGLTPMQWADQNAAEFQRAFGLLELAYDDFIRTTQERHKSRVREYIAELQRTGDVYLGDFEGWYDVNAEAYVTETRAKETNYTGDNGKPLVKRREQNYYFRLSRHATEVRRWIESGAVQPQARRNEVLARVDEGLEDVPISRPITSDPATQFGIRMPSDDSHRIYVWIDALFNYLSAVDTDDRRRFWPPSVHIMGKEIIWFHAVIWPAILMALSRPLPRLIYAHAHYIREGKKMSKSLGNFIDLAVLDAYRASFGLDALRWYLITQGPLGANDADFSHAQFVEVYNADLANGIGNCASRVGNMIDKYFHGALPAPAGDATAGARAVPIGGGRTIDLPAHCAASVETALKAAADVRVDDAVREGMNLVGIVDAYINATEPFKLAKRIAGDPVATSQLASILYNCAETLRIASLLLAPAIPAKMQDLWRRWSCSPATGTPLAKVAGFGDSIHGLRPGTPISKGEPLFMRADPAAPAPAAS